MSLEALQATGNWDPQLFKKLQVSTPLGPVFALVRWAADGTQTIETFKKHDDVTPALRGKAIAWFIRSIEDTAPKAKQVIACGACGHVVAAVNEGACCGSVQLGWRKA